MIATRDAEVAAPGRALYPLHGFAGDVQRWIHAAESTDIRYNIQVVAEQGGGSQARRPLRARLSGCRGG